MNIKPLGDRVVYLEIGGRRKDQGGIVLPGQAKNSHRWPK
jgi:co-chaperonin GroES (HSP10)